MHRTSGIMTSTMKTDVTCPLCVFSGSLVLFKPGQVTLNAGFTPLKSSRQTVKVRGLDRHTFCANLSLTETVCYIMKHKI